MTQRQRLFNYVRSHPDRSAYQICVALNIGHASGATALKRMVDAGVLTRTAGMGPGGGYTYRV